MTTSRPLWEPIGRRTIHLIDIENLLGSPRVCEMASGRCRGHYSRQVGIGANDLVVLATNPFVGYEAGVPWNPARLLVRHGSDGADLRLLDVIRNERLSKRFDRVYLGSGDAIFTDAVAWLARQGTHVTVIARPEAAARRLRMAAADFIPFSPGPPTVHKVAA
jgi:hypothetical protein